jgi:hypothetical protein
VVDAGPRDVADEARHLERKTSLENDAAYLALRRGRFCGRSATGVVKKQRLRYHM